MTTRDTPEAALTAALHKEDCHGTSPLEDDCNCDVRAAVILAALDGWTLVPSDAVIVDAEQLARAIHGGRIAVAKHGKFTDRCICNALAAAILRGMSKMVPRPSLDKVIAEFAPLAPAPSEHKPGDPHQYRITCEVCGERGTIRLSVDPETALAPAPSEPD